MSEPGNSSSQPEIAAQPSPPPGFRLTIVLQPSGEIWVQGPLQNKSLCKAILAGGERKIEEFDPANPGGPRVVVPSLVAPRNLRPA